MKNHRWAWPLLAVLAVALTVLTADSGVANSSPSPDLCKASVCGTQSCQVIGAPEATCAKQTCASAATACKDASTAECAKADSCAAVSKCTTACKGDCTAKCTKACAGTCGAKCGHSHSAACGATCKHACAGICEASCCGSCAGTCSAKCKHSHSAACGATCKHACAGTCGASCCGSCAGTCGAKCKHSHARICGPRCRTACHGNERCACGKVSCHLYGIGCGKARHGKAAHSWAEPRCQKACCASPGKVSFGAKASKCPPGCDKPCCNPPKRKVKRLSASECAPGCQKACCASPGKVAKRVWVEKSGSSCEKAGIQKVKEVSCYLEGSEGSEVRVIKGNPGDEYVWMEAAEAGFEKDREGKAKKIRTNRSGDAEVKEVYIDDDGVWHVDTDDEGVYILKSDEGEMAHLGVYLQDLTPELREAFDLPHDLEGALVTDVERSSPARKSGIRKGFVVVEFDGTPIRSADDLVKAVRASEPGDRVTLVMIRRGSTITSKVTLGSGPAEVKMLRDFDIERPEVDVHVPEIDIDMSELGEMVKIKRMVREGGGFLGVSTETLTDKQRDKLDLPDDIGVMVNEVQEGTAADKVGLQQGDIILMVDGDEIEDTEDLVEAISSREPGDEVTLVLLRDGKKKKVDVELGERELAASIERVGPIAMKIKPGMRLEMRRDALKEHMLRLQHRIQELEEELEDLEDELEELEEEED